MLRAMENRLRRWLYGRDLAVWYSPDYRLPLGGVEGRTGFEPRRADHVIWFLLERRAIARGNLRTPQKAEYADLARVHGAEYLDSLARPETLAKIFGVDAAEVPVDELMNSIRLACGGTLQAAREVLSLKKRRDAGRRALNLLGGFHHAKPDSGGGFCAVNDIAVAVAALRDDGFAGRVAVLDLDAHPPDGTAACLSGCWIGSISGSDWGPLPGVDETVLPERAGDQVYLAALDKLLSRMPASELVFVVAGGDVLAGDPIGRLGLTLAGCRERDLRVSDALLSSPSVWLSAGGYSGDAWRVLAGTGLALGIRSRVPLPRRYDPLVARFSEIARTLAPEDLGRRDDFNLDDVAVELGLTPRRKLWLGFYTVEGIEHALHRYGILPALRRLGYGPLRFELHDEGVGEGARVVDLPSGETLIDVVLERKEVSGAPMLYVHWLTLRNPRARGVPLLPGQTAPGLGLAREMTELLGRIAVRLGLEGLAFRPAAFHTAYRGRGVLHFLDPARQGRFEALVEALNDLPLAQATQAVDEGRVLLNGAPYAWEAEEMVKWLEPHAEDRAAVEAARAASHFTLA